MIEIAVGDFIVCRSTYSRSLRRVTRTTKEFVYGIEDGWKREWRCNRSAVLFAGQKDVAQQLFTALDASGSEYHREHIEILKRKKDRDDAAILAATKSV